jgi:hypothetical protein
MNSDTWAYVLFHSYAFLWSALAVLAFAVWRVVLRYEQKIKLEKAATYAGMVGVLVEALAVANSQAALDAASEKLAAMRAGLFERVCATVLEAACQTRQHRHEVAFFETVGEHARLLFIGNTDMSPEVALTYDLIFDQVENPAPDALERAVAALTEEGFTRLQMAIERAMVAMYTATLEKPPGEDEIPGLAGVLAWFGRIGSWLNIRWGRMLCFSVGPIIMLLAMDGDQVNGDRGVFAGAALLAAGLFLQWVAKVKTPTT